MRSLLLVLLACASLLSAADDKGPTLAGRDFEADLSAKGRSLGVARFAFTERQLQCDALKRLRLDGLPYQAERRGASWNFSATGAAPDGTRVAISGTWYSGFADTVPQQFNGRIEVTAKGKDIPETTIFGASEAQLKAATARALARRRQAAKAP